MDMSKNIGFTVNLIEGSTEGLIQCFSGTWKGFAYKISRSKYKEYKKVKPTSQDNDPFKHLRHFGVYLLLGTDGTNVPAVYVGQSEKRKKGESFFERFTEHDEKYSFWDNAIAFTHNVDDLGSTELDFLEHELWAIAKNTCQYKVMNNKEPSRGNPSPFKQNDLKIFIDNVKLITEIFGHKVFVSKFSTEPVAVEDEYFYLVHSKTKENSKGKIAKVKYVDDNNFLLLNGSYIRMMNKSTSSSAGKLWQDFGKYINTDGLLKKDILIKSLSALSSFVLGSSSSDGKRWKRKKDGKTLEEVAKVFKQL